MLVNRVLEGLVPTMFLARPRYQGVCEKGVGGRGGGVGVVELGIDINNTNI